MRSDGSASQDDTDLPLQQPTTRPSTHHQQQQLLFSSATAAPGNNKPDSRSLLVPIFSFLLLLFLSTWRVEWYEERDTHAYLLPPNEAKKKRWVFGGDGECFLGKLVGGRKRKKERKRERESAPL